MTAPQLPEGRYGRRSRPAPRWVLPLLLGLVVLAGVGVAVLGYRNLAEAPIEGRRLGFTLHDGSAPGSHGGPAVTLRFEVARDDPGRPGVCIVRARSLDGSETGRREVYVPPAQDRIELTTVIRTSRPPVTAEVYGCSLRVPAYLNPPQRPGSSR